MMPSFGDGIVALAAGFGFGAFFFGGLWWTSRRVLTSRAPGLLMAGSFLVRMAVFLGGLWLVTAGRLVETFVYVIGALGARYAVVAYVGKTRSGEKSKEAGP